MLTQILSDKQVEYAAMLIARAERIVILTHQNPDGDAMGSSLGMRHYLMGKGKRKVTNVVPSSYPDFLQWLPCTDAVVPYDKQPAEAEQALREADLVICTDFAEPKRIAGLGSALQGCEKPVLIIDHHLLNQKGREKADTTMLQQMYREEQIIYPSVASASELVFRLVYRLSLREGHTEETFVESMTADFATCIYTGMMTDTGNFSYNSCEPEMYSIVAMLLKTGINKDVIYDKVFNSYTADRLRLIGYCLYRKMRLFEEYHAALITLDRKEMYMFNAKSGDMEGIVNLPLQIADIRYAVFMREDKIPPHQVDIAGDARTKVKISLRSQGERPVNKMASEVFRGGGHSNASGGEFFGTIAEAVEALVDAMPRYFKKD